MAMAAKVLNLNCPNVIFDFFFVVLCRNEKREMQEMQNELEDLRDCGLGNCRPAFLQSCANIKVKRIDSTLRNFQRK